MPDLVLVKLLNGGFLGFFLTKNQVWWQQV